MKIDELIKELEAVKEEHGNLEISAKGIWFKSRAGSNVSLNDILLEERERPEHLQKRINKLIQS